MTHRRPTHGPRTALAECGELTVPVERKKGRKEERKKGREEERTEDGEKEGVKMGRERGENKCQNNVWNKRRCTRVLLPRPQYTVVLVIFLLSLLLPTNHRSSFIPFIDVTST